MDGDGHKEPIKYIDRTKLSAYERQRVKDIWLSTPKEAVVPKLSGVPPQPRKTPFGFSAPALKAKCSPHIEYLAEARNPLPKVHFVTRAEKEAQREMEEDMTKEELRWLKRVSYPTAPSGVKKAALHAKITPRVENMALPRLSQPESGGDCKRQERKKKSLPSHFPLPEKRRLSKSKSPRVCGCAESIKRKLNNGEDLAEQTK